MVVIRGNAVVMLEVGDFLMMMTICDHVYEGVEANGSHRPSTASTRTCPRSGGNAPARDERTLNGSRAAPDASKQAARDCDCDAGAAWDGFLVGDGDARRYGEHGEGGHAEQKVPRWPCARSWRSVQAVGTLCGPHVGRFYTCTTGSGRLTRYHFLTQQDRQKRELRGQSRARAPLGFTILNTDSSLH